jgi:DMATS type aromatic prenyltransferase
MPWESLVSVLGFQNEDQKFWWQSLAPVLGKFMSKSQYNIGQQYAYLSWFHNFILPALGPRPEPEKERTWRCQLTHNAVPFQPSWNFHANKTTVRFTVEPVGFAAGTKEDVFNQRAGFDLMKRLKTAMPDMQDDWFYHCARELYVPKDLINMMLLVGGPPKGPKPPTVFIAFDLNDKIETKAYFFPHIRAKVLGITQGELILNTVRGFNGNGIDLNPSLDAFEEYLNSGGPVDHKNVEMLAIDCIDPKKARAKIYVNSFSNSFNKIKDIYTMGGRLNGKEIDESLVALKDLWRILFDMPETGFEDTVIPNIMHPRSCFVTGFEFKSGDPLPTSKVYFPMWHYLKTDKQMSDALSLFFARQGWDKLAKSYGSDLKEIL